MVYTQGRGEIQLTFSPRVISSAHVRTSALEGGIEYGVTSAWQLQMDWDGFVRQVPKGGLSTRGVGDLSVPAHSYAYGVCTP